MPSKYIIRDFKTNNYYHVYNRGFAKEDLFLSNDDYKTFLDYLKIYLLPKDLILTSYPKLPARLTSKNLSEEVEIACFCLMPNHYHLLLKEKKSGGISKLIKQLSNAYTYYFNQKYEKEGSIFQGKYKAVFVDLDNLPQMVKYIHLNPIKSWLVDDPKDYKWSSHREYLEEKTTLCQKKPVMKYFETIKDYSRFISDQKSPVNNSPQMENIVIDNH